ncbi:MAG: ribosome maturation factor RimM [Betaproteobacteria bacterium]|nr:ribosome maturation factor RimM [Betaproteobacteria bacterium]
MIVMGHLGAPFGVQGWIRVQPYTENPESLATYPVWWVGEDGRWQEVAVAETARHGKGLVVRFRAVTDREQAAELTGFRVAVPRDRLPEVRGEFYWADLIGLKVVNLQGVDLGVVRGLIATGANDVLEVQGERGRLIPFIGQAIVEVDLAGGWLRVDWDADF